MSADGGSVYKKLIYKYSRMESSFKNQYNEKPYDFYYNINHGFAAKKKAEQI